MDSSGKIFSDNNLYQFAFKMITRRQGGGDGSILNSMLKEPTTKPTKLAFECDLVLKEIDVVILTGGQGTRLREVIKDRPKTMAEINQRPFLDILINHVSRYGFKRFILCTGHMADVIKNYYTEKNVSGEVLFSNEDNPLGTGGAVKNAEDFIQSNPCLVMNGDSFCSVDLLSFFDFHLKKGLCYPWLWLRLAIPKIMG